MKLSNTTRSIILNELEKQNISKKEFAESLGHTKSWATKLANGKLLTLSDDTIDNIEEILGIALTQVTEVGLAAVSAVGQVKLRNFHDLRTP